MASAYWIDWDDPPFPRVRPITSAPEGTTPMTLGEAKKEIIDAARQHRQHWLAIIHQTKAATVAKVDREDY